MDWKVFKGVVEKFPHENADSLEIIKVGDYQLVSAKGNYNSGDTIIVIPEKSLLKNGSMLQAFGKYLSGSAKNRVKSISLRGELSQGITWPILEVKESHGERIYDLVSEAPLGEDISELLDIKKYEPPIPAALAGQVRGIQLFGNKTEMNSEVHLYRHDCVSYGAFSKNLDTDEEVIITEKIHGSLMNYAVSFTNGELDNTVVTSKGLLGKGLSIDESESNFYWKTAKAESLDLLTKAVREKAVELKLVETLEPTVVHLVGECIPVQSGFSYGLETSYPRFVMFDIVINGKHYGLSEFGFLKPLWAPVLYRGKLSEANVYELATGKETFSGLSTHIREGVVVQPKVLRKDRRNSTYLKLKVINPAYLKRETGEEIS